MAPLLPSSNRRCKTSIIVPQPAPLPRLRSSVASLCCNARPLVPLSNLSTDANSGSPDTTLEIKSWLFVVSLFVLKWSFRAVLLPDAVLFWRHQRHCLGIL